MEFESSQDYDLALRVIERLTPSSIRHIPHVLYHERMPAGPVVSNEAKNTAARRAMTEYLARQKIDGVEVSTTSRGMTRLSYPLPDPAPSVSVIIPTRDRVDLLARAVHDVLNNTAYPNLEVVIVNNQSSLPETINYLREIRSEERVRVLDFDAPFNYSAINNFAINNCGAEIICLLNNDVAVISNDWLREMVSHACRPDIGIVGAKLYYLNDTIQHAGVLLGIGGVAGHAHHHLARESPGYRNRAMLIQNYAAVTGACMVFRRDVFQRVGGLEENNLPVAFNDVDFCLRVHDLGYRILWTPYAELYHLESASRGTDELPEARQRFFNEQIYMKVAWGEMLSNDPYYNPNLTVEAEDFSLARFSRAVKPWRRLRAKVMANSSIKYKEY